MAQVEPLSLSVAECMDQADHCWALARKVAIGPQQVMLEHIAETWVRIADAIRDRGHAVRPGRQDAKI